MLTAVITCYVFVLQTIRVEGTREYNERSPNEVDTYRAHQHETERDSIPTGGCSNLRGNWRARRYIGGGPRLLCGGVVGWWMVGIAIMVSLVGTAAVSAFAAAQSTLVEAAAVLASTHLEQYMYSSLCAVLTCLHVIHIPVLSAARW